jgi:hypothetical protein
MYGASFGGDKNVLNYIVVMVAHLWEYTEVNKLCTVHG